MIVSIDNLEIVKRQSFKDLIEERLLLNSITFIFSKNDLYPSDQSSQRLQIYILIKDQFKISNQLIKSIIHLLSNNSYFNIIFISEETLLKENLDILEAFSVNNDSNQIHHYSSLSDSFLSLILKDLQLISKEKIDSPVSEIKFVSLNNLI